MGGTAEIFQETLNSFALKFKDESIIVVTAADKGSKINEIKDNKYERSFTVLALGIDDEDNNNYKEKDVVYLVAKSAEDRNYKLATLAADADLIIVLEGGLGTMWEILNAFIVNRDMLNNCRFINNKYLIHTMYTLLNKKTLIEKHSDEI